VTRPNGNGYSTAGLRDDPRQWLIYQDEQQGAVMRALETAALQIVGQALAKNADPQVRPIGNVMLKVADARLRGGFNAGGYRQRALEYLAKITNWISAPNSMPRPDVALDELHAVLYQLDHRMNSAGINGTGFLREIIRGD